MNIHDFFQKSVRGLEKYILIHYDQDYWFENWVGLSDVRKYFETHEGSLGNPYFSFDWRSAAYRKMAEEQTIRRIDVVKQADPDETIPLGMLTVDEAHEYFMKNNYALDDKYLLRALMDDGWKSFCAGIHPKTDPVKEEALACLTAIATDEHHEDRFVHLLWSLKIEHVNGAIAQDYGGLSYLDVDFVRTNGIRAMFGTDEVEKFMRGEHPPIEINLRRLQLTCK